MADNIPPPNAADYLADIAEPLFMDTFKFLNGHMDEGVFLEKMKKLRDAVEFYRGRAP